MTKSTMAPKELFDLIVMLFQDITNLSLTDVTTTFATILCTLLTHHIFFGKRQMRNSQKLAKALNVAEEQLAFLKEKQSEPITQLEGGKVRIFMEGAFDLMHFGHMNAFRLGKSLGTHLVVGVNSDESITECKAAPLMTSDERLQMVRSCKFVDEVVPNTPYIMDKDYIDYIFKTYDIDYIIHGDDPCIVDGR